MEIRFQAVDQHARHAGVVAHLQQRLGPAVETVGNGGVFIGMAYQFSHAQFQRLIFVAHDFHLALLQRDSASSQRAGQFKFTQQTGMFFKEMRMVGQVLGYCGGIQGGDHLLTSRKSGRKYILTEACRTSGDKKGAPAFLKPERLEAAHRGWRRAVGKSAGQGGPPAGRRYI